MDYVGLREPKNIDRSSRLQEPTVPKNNTYFPNVAR